MHGFRGVKNDEVLEMSKKKCDNDNEEKHVVRLWVGNGGAHTGIAAAVPAGSGIAAAARNGSAATPVATGTAVSRPDSAAGDGVHCGCGGAARRGRPTARAGVHADASCGHDARKSAAVAPRPPRRCTCCTGGGRSPSPGRLPHDLAACRANAVCAHCLLCSWSAGRTAAAPRGQGVQPAFHPTYAA